MSKIILSGYYGEQNGGDDALLLVSSWGSRKFLSGDKIYGTCIQKPVLPLNAEIEALFVQEEQERNENLLRLYRHCYESDLILFGGGSVFHSTDKMTRDSDLIDLNRGKGAAAIGVSFGPFRDSAAEGACKKLIEKFNYIGCRDEESYELIRSFSSDIKVELTFDLAVLLPLVVGENFNGLHARKGLGISLCHYERYIGGDTSIEKTRMKKIVNVLNGLNQEEIEELVFIDFNGHPLFGDQDIHREVIDQLHTKIPIKHLSYDKDPINTLRTIASLKGLIGMRLHSSVFGYITNTPTIILSYHPKCDGWAKQIQADKEYIIPSHSFEEESIWHALEQIIAGQYRYPKLSIKAAQSLAMKNWEGARWSLSQ
ncbi:polysaccharide pyruvyl transferase family protein [Niallia sp. FSL K6-0212]|uniref:polysaccharide pyruvyl transferase family protein n=1 Tax=Niallia sp. FSL K6-0212 TaxID=2921423 RepID=UPI0011A2E82E